ncbi:hypothetical protein [Halococcus salifodinae]|uniref:Homing endonuclease LAGLIDADG domain-containing protein n=1 Tax=Halococcus salifodinae DSM 8989 TaxID=1227456 RepID=M0ND81_9EURY|nr:hypothetical protein [Halococcus salifodinae]EMA54645.1 hypothetical protein C450_05105 [Halococcus salifodinae DSM 8989]
MSRCGEEYERLAGHWNGPCGPPALDRRQRTLVAGLLLGDGRVGGNGANKHFRLSTRWRPFARWVFAELGWLAATVTRVEDTRDERRSRPPAQHYIVRTHAHPALTSFRAWYQSSECEGEDGGDAEAVGSTDAKRLPAPADLPGGALTSRMGRAWHATAGSLAWSASEYATTRQASFSAEADARAERVMALFESAGLDPTRVGRRVQLPPKQTMEWIEWIGDEPVPGVAYKWAADHEEYQNAKRDAETRRARLWYECVAAGGTGGSDGA